MSNQNLSSYCFHSLVLVLPSWRRTQSFFLFLCDKLARIWKKIFMFSLVWRVVLSSHLPQSDFQTLRQDCHSFSACTLTLPFKGGHTQLLTRFEPWVAKQALMSWGALPDSWFIENVYSNSLSSTSHYRQPFLPLRQPFGLIWYPSPCVSLVDFFFSKCRDLYLILLSCILLFWYYQTC